MSRFDFPRLHFKGTPACLDSARRLLSAVGVVENSYVPNRSPRSEVARAADRIIFLAMESWHLFRIETPVAKWSRR
jgi:hypothetical protein